MKDNTILRHEIYKTIYESDIKMEEHQRVALVDFIEQLLAKKMEDVLNTDKVTRVEVIDYTKDVLDDNRRAYVKWDKDIKVELSFQDDNRTLKIFITKYKR